MYDYSLAMEGRADGPSLGLGPDDPWADFLDESLTPGAILWV